MLCVIDFRFRIGKIIKIHQDFPELWSRMYCHVFTVRAMLELQALY